MAVLLRTCSLAHLPVKYLDSNFIQMNVKSDYDPLQIETQAYLLSLFIVTVLFYIKRQAWLWEKTHALQQLYGWLYIP